MVVTYRRPGVYLEESLLVNPGTDVASTITVGCFVGVAPKGPGNVPQLVESWNGYTSIFGGFGNITPPPTDPNDITADALGGQSFDDLADLQDDDVLGDGAYDSSGNPPFGPGQYVMLDDRSKAHYSDPDDRTSAVFGTDPVPDDLATLKAHATYGDAVYSAATFTAGQYVILGDASQANWDGDSWETGAFAGTGAGGTWQTGAKAGTGEAIVQDPDVLSYLPHAVYSFFQNGGRFCWVIRATPTSAGQKGTPSAVTVTGDNTSAPSTTAFKINALSPGEWGDNIAYKLIHQAMSGPTGQEERVFALQVLLRNPDEQVEVVETFTSLSMSGEVPGTRRVNTAINDPNNLAGSRYIYISDMNSAQSRPNTSEEAVFLTDGVDPAVPSPAAMIDSAEVITAVEGPINLNIVGYLADASKENTAFVAQQWRGTWLDPRQAFPEREDIVYFNDSVPPRYAGQSANSYFSEMENKLRVGTNSYIAGYGPWILVPDPQGIGSTVSVPPAGAVMGVASRIDATVGVFRAPAGTVASIFNAVGVQTKFTDAQLGDFNSQNINVIRSVVGAGICVMGARTRKSYGVDRYLSARRTLIAVKEALRRSTQWAVFENNDEELWSGLRMTAERILRPLWEQGGLRGSTTDQAYYVLCDESLNTATVIQSGEVRMEVGVALQYPAEFVVIKITQFDSGTSTAEVQPVL